MHNLILAQSSSDGGGSLATLLIFVVGLGALFWFLIIRPQRNQMRRHRELLGSLAVGDRVYTRGGIVGSIRTMDDETVTIETGDGVRVEVLRGAIASKVGGTEVADS